MITPEDRALLARLGDHSLSATERLRVSRLLGLEAAAEVSSDQLIAELANQNRYLTQACNTLVALQAKKGEKMAQEAFRNQIDAAPSPFVVDVLIGFAQGLRMTRTNS